MTLLLHRSKRRAEVRQTSESLTTIHPELNDLATETTIIEGVVTNVWLSGCQFQHEENVDVRPTDTVSTSQPS